MRAVVQRVSKAGVTTKTRDREGIGPGLLVLLGVKKGDSESECKWLAQKILGLRIFEDDQGKMNRSVVDLGGDILVISQFTLYGDCRKGRRPGFDQAAPPEVAIPLYKQFLRDIALSTLPTGNKEEGHFKLTP